ncbi:MAG: efflux transporter periplasmic adaptor subunit [Planctomycetes bacterium]|nr:efflux transporter periplasmic adaptor subunit [Planctomycetota bacterium]
MTKDNKTFWLLKPQFKILAGIVVIIAAGVSILKFFPSKREGLAEDIPTFTVKQGPMRISVTESGTISAREQVIIKSQVEGVTTILSLVPEGTLVKKGDLLIELDASKLLDKKIDQEIRVQNAEAAFVSSRENLAVTKNQVQSDIDKAELTLKLANLDLEKYTDPNGGEYSNQLMDTRVRITLAEGELKRAESRLEGSEKLAKEKYISETELERDRLDAKKADLNLKLARSDLKLLENFTYNRKLEELRSDVRQSEMALERSKRKATADVVQAEADLRAKESEYKRQQDKLKKIEEQIEKTKIYAPSDGLVIYATSVQSGRRGNAEPLSEGQEVRQRQELIYLPTALAMKAKVKIHEASIKKVTLGLPAKIEVEALPGRVFTGNIVKIAPLPDAQMAWLNPDLKVYNTEININEEDSDLRTGMSCKAEIIIDEYENVIYVPIQAVIRINDRPTVYVRSGNSSGPREVELGLDNNRMIHIIKGLKPGEEVLLNPPLAAGEIGTPPDNVPKTKAPNSTDE